MTNSYLFCRVAYAPVRKEANDSSEMVTQFLFGETAEILQTTEKWLEVKLLEDGYIGFVDPKQFILISDIERENWCIGRSRYFHALTINTPREKMQLPAGCFVKDNFAINNQLYAISAKEQPFSDWKSYAASFLNVPYLWGGRSNFGIDCSGFTQQVMRFKKIELPRDASQQIHFGKNIPFEEREVGDIAFFHNASGKITHVGILLENNKIIHASGFVKIDTLTEEGIICHETQQITHLLNCVKRID